MGDPIAAPNGIMPDDIVDPEKVGEEVQGLARVADQTTQYQWTDNAFASENVLEEGGPVAIGSVEQEGHLYQEVFVGGIANPNSHTPVLNEYILPAATPDENLFQVPYNRGLVPVTGSRYDWTSTYPELVWIIASYQYMRLLYNKFGNDPDENGVTHQIRYQARLALDGSPLPGTGPAVNPVQTRYRGAGYARRSTSMLHVWMGMIPAGSHFAELYAGQAPSQDSPADEVVEADATLSYSEHPPSTGVCVGNRQVYVVRFPFGLMLGA